MDSRRLVSGKRPGIGADPGLPGSLSRPGRTGQYRLVESRLWYRLRKISEILNMEKAKVLIVDDEEDLCRILQFNLENEGYCVQAAYSGEEALEKIDGSFDLVLLDVMMGGINGFETANAIRKEKKLDVPIVFLTAKDTENDLLTGFSLGADDYIAKPFSIKEVNARVKALLNRTRNPRKGQVRPCPLPNHWEDGNLMVDYSRKDVLVNGLPVQLTRREFELFRLLFESPDRVFSREEILKTVWPEDGCVLDRTVDVHITRLRKKLQSYGSRIMNRSGYGYYFSTL